MKLRKYFVLAFLLMFASELFAQSTAMLWGYSDNPKRVDSFNFFITPKGGVSGILCTFGFNIESFSFKKDPFVFESDVYANKTITVSSDFKSATLEFPDGSCINYRLAIPPNTAIMNSNNGFNGNSNNGGSCVGTKTCTLCHGKGWVAGNKTPTYGNGGSYYCAECGREVPASHSHDRCPSCGGKGTVPTIR